MTRLVGIFPLMALLATGCEPSEQPNFLGPAFATTAEVPNPCPGILGGEDPESTTKYEIMRDLYLGIDPLFKDVRSRNAARTHLDNVVREICEQDWVGADAFVHTFIQQVEGQPDDKLMETPSAEDLIAWVQVLAYDMPYDGLPEGALAVEGGLALSTGGADADPVKTRNQHVIVNASDFPAGGPFVVAIAPGSGEIGDYMVYRHPLYGTELYEIMTDYVPPVGSSYPDVWIVFCGPYSSNLDLRIAHDKGATVELLTTEPIDCATQYAQSASSLLPGATGWLGSLARLATGTLRKVLGPAPLYARAETGLGGRAKSFSPFALVYPLAELVVTCESRATGTLEVKVGDELACSDAMDAGATVAKIQVPVGEVKVIASAVGYKRRHDIWYSSGNLELTDDCPLKGTTPATCTFTLPPAGGSLNVKLTGY